MNSWISLFLLFFKKFILIMETMWKSALHNLQNFIWILMPVYLKYKSIMYAQKWYSFFYIYKKVTLIPSKYSLYNFSYIPMSFSSFDSWPSSGIAISSPFHSPYYSPCFFCFFLIRNIFIWNFLDVKYFKISMYIV